LANGFSKKLENHMAALAVYFMYYNFVRNHQTLRVTPGDGCGRHVSALGDFRYGGAFGCGKIKLTHYQSSASDSSDQIMVGSIPLVHSQPTA
jgi:hypothetical protein